MANGNESEQHLLLKDFSEDILRRVFDIPDQFIEREFAFGKFRFDVAAIPPPEAPYLTSIGVECGRKKSTWRDNEEHFQKALRYVDLILWFPYTIYESAYMDLMGSITEQISTPSVTFEIHDDRYLDLKNIAVEEDLVAGLLISKKGRYPKFDNWLYEAKYDFVL